MTVRGIEAIKLYMPPTNSKMDTDVREEKEGSAGTVRTNSESSTMTSVERYRLEWTQLLQTLDEKPDRIRDLAFAGSLKMSKFRSVYWTLLLRVLNADHRNWCTQRTQQRRHYEKLKREFIKNPHETDTTNDDPLSQSSQSVWNQYFSDQELFAVIRQDVVRTFPGVDFFRKALVQSAMCNILFYYAREHPYMCYRQGMHEILAPIIFVMYSDEQFLLHFKEIVKTSDIDETLLNILDPDYLEADSYFLFSRLMSSIESYYRVANPIHTEGSYLVSPPIENYKDLSNEVEVIGQLNSIRDKILAKEDLHLHNYLMKLDIPLHIFGIRWLRLLFGREFALLDLLVLWDAIFADSDRFELPNYIVVAMLIRIRDKLLLSDYTTCLTYLMRYPTNVDVNLILRHALHMQMPKKFDRPPNAFVYFTMQSNANLATGKGKSGRVPSTTARENVTNMSILKAFQQSRARSSSLGEAVVQLEDRITQLQTHNAAEAAFQARLKTSANENRTVMDGYADNNPELMRLELRNAQTVIAVTRSKLQSYLATVRRHIAKQSTAEVMEALDGIEELCQLLDVKFLFPLHTLSTPIDQALEANEQLQQRQRAVTNNRSSVGSGGDSDASLKSNNQTNNNSPLSSSFATYERPDNGFMFQSKRMLGQLKEIELIPISSDEKIDECRGPGSNESGLPAADPLSAQLH